MTFPERFSNLPDYAFPRLRALLDHLPAGDDPILMSLGEPKHAMPSFVGELIGRHLSEFNRYPNNNGSADFMAAVADWINARYGVSVNPDTQIMALNGSREGLFSASLALCPEKKSGKRSKVLVPNPFYPVYMVGAITANADPVFVAATAETGFLPDFNAVPVNTLEQTAAVYLCSPSNPQGAIADKAYWTNLINLAEQYDFKIFADECYSEIYRDEKPKGALEVAVEIGADPERVLILNSLSKRSNLPGLRAGFVAGGPKSIAEMKKLRAYCGAPVAGPLQAVAAACYRDEEHVIENRRLYKEKYELADRIFADVEGYQSPQAGFFIWLPVDDGEAATVKLWTKRGIRTLPGAYLGQTVEGVNPGQGYIRIAMVAAKDETEKGLQAIFDCLY